MVRLRPRGLLLVSTLLALGGCGGGGATAPPTCPPGTATYALIRDPMTQPAAGAVGVPTTVGSITVPLVNYALGATIQLGYPALVGPEINGGVFTASGTSSLTATIPKLQPNTTYFVGAVGVPCGPDFDFGQFTTGAT